VCCAVDLAPAVRQLRMEDYDVMGYFHNPNIQPEDEYTKRLRAVWKLALAWEVPIVVPLYDPASFLRLASGLWNAPERGRRCELCIGSNLKATRDLAASLGIKYFATTLTASRYKDIEMVNRIGESLSTKETVYLASAFRKSGGQEFASHIVKMYNLYRQNYCGCIFSKRDRLSKRRESDE